MADEPQPYTQIAGKAVHGVEADLFACNLCGVVVFNKDLHTLKAHTEEVIPDPMTPSQTYETVVITPDG